MLKAFTNQIPEVHVLSYNTIHSGKSTLVYRNLFNIKIILYPLLSHT